MSTEKECRIRLRWPSGAEFEAQGSPEFLAKEGRDFLTSLAAASTEAMSTPPGQTPGERRGEPRIAWEQICEQKGAGLQLRAKLPAGATEREACLVLLACAQKRLGQSKPTATQLAKWLRRSGYPVTRMDRALQASVAEGHLLPSGSRRARRYELTAPGRLKALLLAESLTRLVS